MEPFGNHSTAIVKLAVIHMKGNMIIAIVMSNSREPLEIRRHRDHEEAHRINYEFSILIFELV